MAKKSTRAKKAPAKQVKPAPEPRWIITDERRDRYLISVNNRTISVTANTPLKLTAEQREVLENAGIAYKEVSE